MEDIRETGPVGLKGLKGLNQSQTGLDPLDPLAYHSGRNIKGLTNTFSSEPREYVGSELAALGYGNSQYDKGITDISQAYDINEYRAEAQPWYDKIANGALKMVTTAATTFIDGTVGTLYGLGTGIANLLDDDPNTGFWRGMWDNAVSNAMADVNDKMEEVAKNYRTHWEENASVFERMFSGAGMANFWGDDILKNAGFTIGAAASIWATGAAGSALKGIPGLATLGRGLGLVAKGEQGLKATGAGKAASWLAKTFVSTQGEGAIESINAIRQSEKNMLTNLKNRVTERNQDAEIEYQLNLNSGMDPAEARLIYNDRLDQINKDAEAYKVQMQKELSAAGNMIYAANIAALSLSNNLTLGSMIRGGFDTSKSLLSQAVRTSAGKPVNTAREAGEALLRGDLRFDAPQVNNKFAKAFGYWGLTATQEGLEEGVQNLASNTGQIRTEAKMNKWAKDNTMLGTMLNPDATEDLIDYTSALGKAYEDQFGSLNSPGWTEVVAGFITGAVGTASAHRNSEGNIRPTWQGGVKEAWNHITGHTEAIQKQADLLNNALSSNKFGDRVRHAVQQAAIRKAQNEALGRDDIQEFKNLEIQQLLSDAVFFRDMGMLDDYLAMYEAMSDGITDTDVAELKAMAKPEDGSPSALETMTDDEIKKTYQDKAKTALDKINKALEDYKAIEAQYGDKFSDDNRREALMQMAYLDTLYWDTQRRYDEMTRERDELEANNKRTPIDDLRLKHLNDGLKGLEKQAKDIRDKLNEYKNSPSRLEDEVKKAKAEHQKMEMYKKADKAIEKYKEASTLQDIVDIFSHSPVEDREAVLNQAIEQSEGETKAKLEQFRNYIGDVNTLERMIEDRFPVSDDNVVNVQKQMMFKSILNDIVNEMLSDENPVINRDSLKDKLKARLADLEEQLSEYEKEAVGVILNDDGTLDFEKALESGEVVDDDFIDVLDDADTGEYHREIKEGSNADKKATAAFNAKDMADIINDMNYFIDSMDKLDELREASRRARKPKSKKSESKRTKGKSTTFTEEVIEGDPDSGEDGESGSWDEEESDSKEESKEEKGLLIGKEKNYYAIEKKKGKSGIEYNIVRKKGLNAPDSIKKAVGTRRSNASRKAELLMDAFMGESAKDRKDTIETLLDLIKTSILNDSTIKELERFFERNSSYIKAESSEESSLPDHKNGESLADTETSMNGNTFPGYVRRELADNSKMVAITRQGSGSAVVQEWLRTQGFNIQYVIDNYLGKIVERDSGKKVSDRTPIYYIHTNEMPNVVFLAMKHSDVESIIPLDKAGKAITYNGENYILVGTFGYEKARKGTQDMFNTVLQNLRRNTHEPSGWFVDTAHTNRIKDIDAGNTVKQTLNDDRAELRDLNELLQDPRNPHGLSIEDLSWTVIEGSEEKPTLKVINGEKSRTYGIKGGRPGQVYLNIPASNGKFIPVYMQTMFLDELDMNTPLGEEIAKYAGILADPAATMQDKKSAIANLNDLLVFSSVNQIHLNDSSSKFDPNTIYITKNGQPLKVIDFTEGTGTLQDLLDALVSINPRINISTTVLGRNPQVYLDSGVLKTDIALLGTVNSMFYTYPVDDEGNYVENKPFKGTGKSYDASTRSRVIIGGRTVFYDGNVYTDVNGNRIEDEDGTFAAAVKIKQGKAEVIEIGKKGNKKTYYRVNGVVYMDNGHGGLNILTSEEAKQIINRGEKKKQETTRKKNAEEKAKEVEKSEEEGKPTPKNTETPKPSTESISNDNFTNGTDIDQMRSQEELERERMSDSFANILKNPDNEERVDSLFSTIGEIYGKEPDTIKEALDILIKNGIDLSSNDIDTIESLIRCHN